MRKVGIVSAVLVALLVGAVGAIAGSYKVYYPVDRQLHESRRSYSTFEAAARHTATFPVTGVGWQLLDCPVVRVVKVTKTASSGGSNESKVFPGGWRLERTTTGTTVTKLYYYEFRYKKQVPYKVPVKKVITVWETRTKTVYQIEPCYVERPPVPKKVIPAQPAQFHRGIPQGAPKP